MSELINSRDDRATIRWKLLTGVSALALTSYISSTVLATAEDSHPVLWLELGGEFQSLNTPSETWIPANLPPVIDHPVAGVLSQTPRIGYDANGKITFRPDDSDWSLSASIQYGKAKRGPRLAHDQTTKTYYNGLKYIPTTYAFTDLHSVEETKHVILDFQAGKDLGLGLLGSHGASAVNFGVRIAQFRETADNLMTAMTSAAFKYPHHTSHGGYSNKPLHAYMHASRSFSGIGPSIAWNGSVPLAGSLDQGLAFDWGASVALLFGRQTTKVRTHTEKIQYIGATAVPYTHLIPSMLTNSTSLSVRKKNVLTPNLGGFAGISYRLNGTAKLSLGYRADFFFNAIDGGIDAHKAENRGFFGPYASISIGLGD